MRPLATMLKSVDMDMGDFEEADDKSVPSLHKSIMSDSVDLIWMVVEDLIEDCGDAEESSREREVLLVGDRVLRRFMVCLSLIA